MIYPASHYVTPQDQLQRAFLIFDKNLVYACKIFWIKKGFVEAQRLEERTRYDLEMLEKTGRCRGLKITLVISVEEEGAPPPTLLEYFPDEWLLVIDESHVTIPQVRAMYKGDRSRKSLLSILGFGFLLRWTIVH